MKPTAILLPVVVQVALTVAVLVAMGPARAASMREKGQRLSDRDVTLGRNDWSDQAIKLANSYRNQFELPVLFYAVVAYALQTSAVDMVLVALAWVFAVSRIVHAAIHIGPNVVAWRGAAFLIGLVALIAMWTKLALHAI
ncbi:MAG: MAPEG family protein [Hyphomicrobiaceae bacterium]|nr:MAPEG family protein [Hyphomicrobiaceae bacterium]